MSHVMKTMSSLTPTQQQEAQQNIKGLSIDLSQVFKDLDLSDVGKTLALAGIKMVVQYLLPKITAANPTLGLVVAGLLDALEKAISK